MGKRGALISGSQAVQFFERVTWKLLDMDNFVLEGEGAARLGRHMSIVEGYDLVDVKTRGPYMHKSVREDVSLHLSRFP